ncbi:MAG TPA: hypothetical protein VMS77_09560, partial [Conexivisphaerales archaeon]|nr:hypothetical protein [Conexivisphaerales archaeon]
AMASPLRPTGVTALAGLAVIGGVYFLFSGAFVSISTLAGPSMGVFSRFSGVMFLFLGAYSSVTGIGLYSGARWAWYLTLIGSLLVIIWGVSMGWLLGLPSAVAATIVATYVGGRDVRTYFGFGQSSFRQRISRNHP